MSEDTVQWFKIPIIGVPGFPTCEIPVTQDGQLIGDDGDPLPIEQRGRPCGQDTLWCVGSLHLCREHFPFVAEAMGDSAKDIEAAWKARL